MRNDFFISTTYLRLLIRAEDELANSLINLMGVDVEALLSQKYVASHEVDTLFHLIKQHGVESWLLRFGSQLNIASHGPLGFAILSAPDLHRALEVLAEYQSIRSSAYVGSLAHRNSRVEFILEDRTHCELTGRWLIEVGIRVVQSLIETIMAHPLGDNARISFTMPKPDYGDELEAFYGVACEFNAEQSAISIPASWCRITSPLYDESSFRSNLAKCREAKLKLEGGDNLASLIRASLDGFFDARIVGRTHGTNIPAMPPTLAQLAAQQCVSARTLSRKLNKQHTSYKDLLLEVRREYAQSLLKGTHLTIADIADKLAYQEQANFIRAFKSWFGTTPAAWRRL